MFFFFSILNESIPKDEADQLLQDLLHEMSKFIAGDKKSPQS